MNPATDLVSFSSAELADLYRYWTGDGSGPSSDEDSIRDALGRLMSERGRVMTRFRDLPRRLRDVLGWMLRQKDFRIATRAASDKNGGAETPARNFELDSILAELKRRGFVVEERDRSWVRYHEPVWRVPQALGELLVSEIKGSIRTVETQISLRAHVRALAKDLLDHRLSTFGISFADGRDRAELVQPLASTERLEDAIRRVSDPRLRDAVCRALDEHGGMLDRGQLERLELLPENLEPWRAELEHLLLGTIADFDLAEVGLLFKPGSMIIFHELARTHLNRGLEVHVDEAPEAPAEPLADLSAIRSFLDHHSVRATREGSLYRATARKMESEVLSPGSRPVSQEAALGFLLEFLFAADLVRVDDDQRLRPRPSWKTFEELPPTARGEQLLRFVQEDLRSMKAEFHHGRLRRVFLTMLKETGAGRWIDLRNLAQLARNFYLATLDVRSTADRFQRRYQYTPIPPLVSLALVTRELVEFAGSRLATAGLVELHAPEDGRPSIRLTRLGSAVLGLAADNAGTTVDGGLIVTADFEIVVFPGAVEYDVTHALGRFARREKADVTVHYRISERSIQEAVAAGMAASEILALLRRHARYDVPQNVVASCEAWARAVTVLESRRTIVLRAASKAALDAAMKVRELKAIVVERISDTVIEVNEDPTTVRIAEALRTQGFFLR